MSEMTSGWSIHLIRVLVYRGEVAPSPIVTGPLSVQKILRVMYGL